MKKSVISIAAFAGALFLASGAMAATLQPAAGEAPFMDQSVASAPSTLTRSAVEQQAAASFPASGNVPFAMQQVASFGHGSSLTRAQVEAQAVAELPAAGQASAWPAGAQGQVPATMQATRNVAHDAS